MPIIIIVIITLISSDVGNSKTWTKLPIYDDEFVLFTIYIIPTNFRRTIFTLSDSH